MNKQHEGESEVIDIRGLLREYVSKWYLFVICIIVCTGIAYLYTKMRQPTYDVRANILISQDEDKSGAASSLLSGFGDIAGVFGSKGKVDDEVYIVKSHSVLRDAVRDLNIHKVHKVRIAPLVKVFHYKDFPVDVFANPAIADTLMTTIRFRVKVDDEGDVMVKTFVKSDLVDEIHDARFPVTVNIPWGRFVINKTKYLPQGEPVTTDIYFSGYDVAAESLAEDVNIAVADKKANVIALQTVSPSTEYAKDVLNTIVLNYNQRGVHEKNLKSQKTADFIDERLALLTDDLTDTEQGMENFKREQGMTDLALDAQYSLMKKSAIEQELVSAQANVEMIKMLRDFISDPKNAYALMPTTVAISDLVAAIQNYNNVMLQRIDLARNTKANSAALQKLDHQIDAMRDAMRQSLEKSYASAQVAARDLQNEVNYSETRLNKMPYQERVYRSILRQQELKEQLYLFLLQRREETSMNLANAVPKGMVVDEAYSISEPMGMSKFMIVLLGFFFGLLLAPMILYVRRALRNKFETKDELEKLTKIPLLGEVCTSRYGKTLVVKPGSTSSVVELIRLIRTNLEFMLNNSSDKVILLTSTVSGEGKSFISINLASSLALTGKKVVLVGMDIRAPKLASYLPISPRFGVTEYLSSDKISLDDIILHNPVAENMDIIAAGPVPPNPGELLLEPNVDEMFRLLREHYDYIIIDSAPVGMVSDTFSLARVADATVYVCRANYTTLRDVKFFNDLYAEKRLPKMGLVVNGTKARSGYGYGYGHTVARKRPWYQFWKKKED